MSGGRPAFPHIGWDPTPGDVQDTRDLARKLGGLARELGTSGCASPTSPGPAGASVTRPGS
ncbi:hypothetical protein ACIG3E_03145 [Streptomyces sp. NPDC053474]|uniref:hypothetical protein n=1 Tax=Streptomyces sp. NPDC053474 TaxID=3365704 RepID=UPI0037D91E54